MQWSPLRPDELPDVSNLPPLDYAKLLTSTAKFYLGSLFALVDEDRIMRNIDIFYENPTEVANSSRTWYSQFLLVLAFGKAFQGPNRQGGLRGHQYALRAMTMLPDMTGLYPDPVLAVQTLALASLYLQSVDMRVAAYYHVSASYLVC